MSDTQDKMSNESSKGIVPVKLEWRSYGSHYKSDVNINEVVSYWCFACGNDYFVPVVVTPIFNPKFLNSMKLEDAMNMVNDWNNTLALCSYNVKTWLYKIWRMSL